MKRWSSKLGLGGGKLFSSESEWTKYDDRLLVGIENEDLSLVKSAMRKKGVSCVKPDKEGRRALHIVCMKGLGRCLKIMLKAEKPDLTTIDASGRAALHLAARSGSEECVKYLLQYKSLVDVQDFVSMTPLHYAVSGGHISPAVLLLRSGAPLNAKDQEGRTPLILAVQSGNKDLVGLLCSAGANLDIQDNMGRTALMFACECGMENIANELLSSGASVGIKDLNGETAESIATSANKHEIVELLRKPLTNGMINGLINNTFDESSEISGSLGNDDSLTQNSSSFDEHSYQESISECSPRSSYQIEQLEQDKFEISDIFKELNCLKSELHAESLKRTKAEDEVKTLRMQLETDQENEDVSVINFSDGDSDDILLAIEKNVPSPLQSRLQDTEDNLLVSALRGEISALELQIERLKKELEDERNAKDTQETKIPLTVYRALKETHEKFKRESAKESESLKSFTTAIKSEVDDLTEENQTLQRKISFYKELLEKGDKSEKIRELNEQIVSLKIKLSHKEMLESEDASLKDENEELRQKLLEMKGLHENETNENNNNHHKGDVQWQEERIKRYRNVLLAAFQGELSMDLRETLSKITQLRSNDSTGC